MMAYMYCFNGDGIQLVGWGKTPKEAKENYEQKQITPKQS